MLPTKGKDLEEKFVRTHPRSRLLWLLVLFSTDRIFTVLHISYQDVLSALTEFPLPYLLFQILDALSTVAFQVLMMDTCFHAMLGLVSFLPSIKLRVVSARVAQICVFVVYHPLQEQLMFVGLSTATALQTFKAIAVPAIRILFTHGVLRRLWHRNKDTPRRLVYIFCLCSIVGTYILYLHQAYLFAHPIIPRGRIILYGRNIEAKLGERASAVANARYPIAKQSNKNYIFLRAIMDRLEPIVPMDHVHVRLVGTDDPPNAFVTLRKDEIFIMRNLLRDQKPSADSMAFIMAHELSHIILRHNIAQLSFANILAHLTVDALHIFTATFNPIALMHLTSILHKPSLMAYTRRHEAEADELGLIIIAMAGFNTTHAESILTLSNTKVQGRQLLRAHPEMHRRARRMRTLAAQIASGERPILPYSGPAMALIRVRSEMESFTYVLIIANLIIIPLLLVPEWHQKVMRATRITSAAIWRS